MEKRTRRYTLITLFVVSAIGLFTVFTQTKYYSTGSMRTMGFGDAREFKGEMGVGGAYKASRDVTEGVSKDSETSAPAKLEEPLQSRTGRSDEKQRAKTVKAKPVAKEKRARRWRLSEETSSVEADSASVGAAMNAPAPAKVTGFNKKRFARHSSVSEPQHTPKLKRLTGFQKADYHARLRVVPSTPGVDPITGLKVVNNKPFHDMYFKHYGVNPTIDTEEEPFSTFSVDTDTGSYTLARSFLERGHLPSESAIRVEEFINAFDYSYRAPEEDIFGVSAEAFPSPNREGYHVLHIGLKGKDVMPENRKPANLVFVIDTSGSMQQENRLGLVKKALGYLVDQLRSDDSVSIVAYGSSAYTVLHPTSGRNKSTIINAINRLHTNGSTNAQAGIHLGYQMAAQRFVEGAINRVILCSDGVANNGITTSAGGIFKTIKDKTAMGVKLSTIGFGMGNYNDVLMEQLANVGDGSYYYVDKPEEARRVFTENLTGLLQVIAKDVKIQVEFDKRKVARYRLLGYENRALKKEDFANDKIDAGEIGAGHTVTAIYEVKFLKQSGKFGKLKIRYKAPEGGASSLIEKSLPFSIVKNDVEQATPPTRLSLAVSAFAEKLRGSYWVRGVEYDEIIDIVDGLAPTLRDRAEVAEFRNLIVRAKSLDNRNDKFETSGPLAMIDFDHVPVLR